MVENIEKRGNINYNIKGNIYRNNRIIFLCLQAFCIVKYNFRRNEI